MIQVRAIGSNNLNHLADMLQEIHRRDLAEKVRKFQADGKLPIFKYMKEHLFNRLLTLTHLSLEIFSTLFYIHTYIHTFIHTLFLPPQRGFSGTMIILHY